MWLLFIRVIRVVLCEVHPRSLWGALLLVGMVQGTLHAQETNLPPAEARAARLFIHHSPVREGKGAAAYDELALVNREETFRPTPIAVPSPGGRGLG